jgi:hypothetical protein
VGYRFERRWLTSGNIHRNTRRYIGTLGASSTSATGSGAAATLY